MKLKVLDAESITTRFTCNKKQQTKENKRNDGGQMTVRKQQVVGQQGGAAQAGWESRAPLHRRCQGRLPGRRSTACAALANAAIQFSILSHLVLLHLPHKLAERHLKQAQPGQAAAVGPSGASKGAPLHVAESAAREAPSRCRPHLPHCQAASTRLHGDRFHGSQRRAAAGHGPEAQQEDDHENVEHCGSGAGGPKRRGLRSYG